MASTLFPDGLEDRHARRRRAAPHASPLALLILGGLLLAALLGVFGGDRSPVHIVDTPAATLTVETPSRLRSGLFFETRVTIRAKRALKQPTLTVSASLWRDMTINTAVPQADKETAGDGRFRFEYGGLKPGDTLELKFDGQINPPLFAGTSGEFALFDGTKKLAAIPLSFRVLP